MFGSYVKIAYTTIKSLIPMNFQSPLFTNKLPRSRNYGVSICNESISAAELRGIIPVYNKYVRKQGHLVVSKQKIFDHLTYITEQLFYSVGSKLNSLTLLFCLFNALFRRFVTNPRSSHNADFHQIIRIRPRIAFSPPPVAAKPLQALVCIMQSSKCVISIA
jgi:hypothetical protein